MSRPILLMCAAFVFGASPARAQKPRLVVVPLVAGDGASETSTLKFQQLLVEQLKARNDAIELVTAPTHKTPGANPATKQMSSQEAAAALDAGKKAFDELRFEDAIAGLKRGIEGALADPSTADYHVVSDAYVKLAAATFRVGEEQDARAALLNLVRLSPQIELPPGYPPMFARELEKAKKRLAKQPKGSVSIEGPPGATAFFNGRDLGMVPVLEENVPVGLHYIEVEGTKGEKFGQVVNLSGSLAKVKASFGGTERAPVGAKPATTEVLVGDTVDEGTKTRLLSYMKTLNVEWAIVGYVYRTSDTQLNASTALFSSKAAGFGVLPPAIFDTDVLTATPEAFKLSEDAVKRMSIWGTAAPLPIVLARQPRFGGRQDRPNKAVDAEAEGASTTSRKVALIPRSAEASVSSEANPAINEKPFEAAQPEAKKGIPAWVWVVTGVAVAAAGVGVGVGITVWNKPVTGTVTATW